MNKDNENSSKAGVSLNASIGKEIDAALGDVVRGLLVKPAEAVGDLTSDAIGILGDRIKRKRQLNARIGLEEVYKKLEENNVDLNEIAPPKEEELHLLINGLSLSDDETVRDMWTGLFAKALEPDSDVTAERPFISVLQSLSPHDAKIIDFLAFVIRADKKLRTESEHFRPKNLQKITKEEAEKIELTKEINLKKRKEIIESIQEKANEYGIYNLSGNNWSENLLRLGIIERLQMQRPHQNQYQIRSLDEKELFRAIDHLARSVNFLDESTRRNMTPPDEVLSKHRSQHSTLGFGPSIQLEVKLSSFGTRLATACGLI